MNYIKKRSLLLIFIVTQFIFLAASTVEIDLLSSISSLSIMPAVILHISAVIIFIFGYKIYLSFTVKNVININNENPKIYILNSITEIILYMICIFGVVIALLQISQTSSLGSYFGDLIALSNVEAVRGSYMATSDEGGIAGILKMWAYGPLAVFLFTIGIVNYLNILDSTRIKLSKLMIFSGIATIIKIIISLDRLSIMAITLSFIFSSIHRDKLFTIRNLFFLIFIFIFATFISLNRLADAGVFDFLVLYCRLGLLNVAVLMDSLNNFSLGFFTVWSPIRPIIKFFTENNNYIEVLNYDYVWHPAQYLLGYAYLDFGYGLFILYLLIGVLAAKLDYSATIERKKWSVAIYFSVVYCYASFIFVPAFTGIEFWLTMLVALFASFGLKEVKTDRKINSEVI